MDAPLYVKWITKSELIDLYLTDNSAVRCVMCPTEKEFIRYTLMETPPFGNIEPMREALK